MKKYKKSKGFSLIELMAVIVILGILASIVVVNVAPVFQRAYLEKIRADLTQVTKALELYRFNELTYPSSDQGLEALTKPHPELKNPFLFPENGYLSSLPLDPWGREYIYEYPGNRSSSYDLYTLGADGIEGGDGENTDFGNWMQ
jgi:general secretion pathway protein G